MSLFTSRELEAENSISLGGKKKKEKNRKLSPLTSGPTVHPLKWKRNGSSLLIKHSSTPWCKCWYSLWVPPRESWAFYPMAPPPPQHTPKTCCRHWVRRLCCVEFQSPQIHHADGESWNLVGKLKSHLLWLSCFTDQKTELQRGDGFC